MPGEATSSQFRRILVVASADAVTDALAALVPHGEMRVVGTTDEALAALREGRYTLVVCSPAELLPMLRPTGQEHHNAILEGMGQGACIVDRDGQVVWTNAALRKLGPAVTEAVRVACGQAIADFAREPNEAAGPHVQQHSVNIAPDIRFDVSISTLPGVNNGFREVIAFTSDITVVSRMREKLNAIDAAGRELVALDIDNTEKLDVGERLQLLEQKLISYCRDLLHFTHFAVLVIDPKTKHLDNVLSGGFSEEAMNINVYAEEEGNGISGYVAATGRSYICRDIHNDPRYLPGLQHAASSLTVPLRLVDRVVGVLNVESDQPAAFTDEDRQVAEILGRYIAVALYTLKLLVAERSETTGQVAADVAAETSHPLNSIVAEVSRLMKDAPGPDESRQRLDSIIQRVDEVKQAMQSAARFPAVHGLIPEARTADPVLKGKRVLVADDEDIIRETISDVLSKAGALPVTARDGDEAVTMVHAQHFDLVLSDIKMPHRNGYEVFAEVKQVCGSCPVILITGFGYDPDHSIVRASREGLSAVLFKPFKVEQLLEAIHNAVVAATE